MKFEDVRFRKKWRQVGISEERYKQEGNKRRKQKTYPPERRSLGNRGRLVQSGVILGSCC